MTFFLVLLGMVILVPEVTSVCPNLANTNGTTTVNVNWGYNSRTPMGCRIIVEGFPLVFIPVRTTQNLPNVFNGCLKFRCNQFHLSLIKEDSACAYGSGCSTEVKNGSSCSQKYTCNNGIYDISSGYLSDLFEFRRYSFKLFSGYTCGSFGSGGCASNQCFNPFARPKQESCVNVGGAVVNGNDVYQCQELTACGSDTYVDLVRSRGCDSNGTFVPEGTVISSDPCYHTVCVVDSSGKGTFQTFFKDYEGCVHRDQCVAVGDTLTDVVLQYTCASRTCRKDTSRETPIYLDIVETGCYYNNTCIPKSQQVPPDGCEMLSCKLKVTTGKYFWGKKYSGCYDPTTNTCSHSDGEEYYLDGCIRNNCESSLSGKWNTWYNKSGSCAPKKNKCHTDGGIPGCYHNGACHPVKTVIKMDNCTQYVCYSKNQDLNRGVYKAGTARPKWKAHATGCYGPTGCMKLGEQYVDPNTLNTYRCDYTLAGLGVKYAQFHRACVAPNGTTLALGKSVFIDPIWYSCYRWGEMKNPIDTSIQFVPTLSKNGKPPTCGHNPNTGKILYRGEYYYAPYGRCSRRYVHCEEICDYFDESCKNLDATRFLYIGDKINLDGAECVCTQDRKINNKFNAIDLSNLYFPSLCGEPGVTNGACADPDDGSVHQWGEFWTRPGSDPLELCTCHPLDRKAFCSDFLPDVLAVLKDTSAR